MHNRNNNRSVNKLRSNHFQRETFVELPFWFALFKIRELFGCERQSRIYHSDSDWDAQRNCSHAIGRSGSPLTHLCVSRCALHRLQAVNCSPGQAQLDYDGHARNHFSDKNFPRGYPNVFPKDVRGLIGFSGRDLDIVIVNLFVLEHYSLVPRVIKFILDDLFMVLFPESHIGYPCEMPYLPLVHYFLDNLFKRNWFPVKLNFELD